MAPGNQSFLDMPAPAGYVPGLGRGATGFTTRSDIGPARNGVDKPTDNQAEENEDDERFQDAENDTGLFSTSKFDVDDEEADKIYSEVDARMEERRKRQRDAREKAEQEEFERNNPKISTQFLDLKRALGTVSAEEWASIPEVGDMTRKNKRQRKNMETRFYAAPESIIAGRGLNTAVESNIGTETPGTQSTIDGTMTDFRTISSAKDKMLGMRLDQAGTASVVNGTSGDSSGGFTNIDPKGYLTSLATNNDFSAAAGNYGDIKRVRPLLESLVKSDPTDARGWILLSRFEAQRANKVAKARSIIQDGCDKCPRNEDVWLENIHINEKRHARIIAAKAVQYLPKSIEIWLTASRLEDDVQGQVRVLKKALESNPGSDTLWKELIKLQDDESEARLLLYQAVELVPLSEELWLALAHLETPAKARKILNKARQALKVSRAIWIAAARLEEQDSGKAEVVDKIMARGVRKLEEEGGLPERSQWISDAQKCEQENAVLTCHAIVKATLGQGLEEEDREVIWMEDGKRAVGQGSYETARAIFAYSLRYYPQSMSFWLATVDLEKNHGTKNAVWEVLSMAVQACPNIEDFWLIYAKEKADSGDISAAQNVLAQAFESNPNNENIWLAAIKLESDNGHLDRAGILFKRAREEAGTERVWVKFVVFERQIKKYDEALAVVDEGIRKYPQSAKLHMQKGQIYEALNESNKAIDAYTVGTRACPKSVPMWILWSRLELQHGSIIKVRSILDRAALVNEKNEYIWLERVRLEKDYNNNMQQANILISKALQECPKSGLLWSENILMQSRIQRKTKILDAVKACENDPYVLTTVARDFWANGKPQKPVLGSNEHKG